MRVYVGKAGHDGLATSVDALGCGIARQQLLCGTDCRDAIADDTDIAAKPRCAGPVHDAAVQDHNVEG